MPPRRVVEWGILQNSLVVNKGYTTHILSSVTHQSVSQKVCQDLCGVRKQCDIFVFFQANNTCQHRTANFDQPYDPSKPEAQSGSGRIGSGVKLTSKTEPKFIAYSSNAVALTIQLSDLNGKNITVSGDGDLWSCGAMCDIIPQCTLFADNRDKQQCILVTGLPSGERALMATVGFKQERYSYDGQPSQQNMP